MTTNDDLDPGRLDELGAAVASPTAAAPHEAAPAPPPPPAGLTDRGKRVARRVLDRVLKGYVERGLDERIPRAIAPIDVRVAEIEDELDDVRNVPVNFELLKAETVQANAVAVNLELLKGEFRTLLGTVEDLGRAIAPGAGLEGASVRIAELRERVNALERRLRQVEIAPARVVPEARDVIDATPAASGNAPTTSAPPNESRSSVLFDYVGFERRFRGDPDEVLRIQRDRYEKRLAAHAPVVDIGCGRGELLEAVAKTGAQALGVDTDPGMVADARARGLEVYEEDAISFLERTPEQSLGSIVSLHVVEHLELDVLIRFLELAATRLKPGGLLIAETPNPASLIVLGNSYILDPTHVRPLHPSLLTFLCEGAGFRDVRLEFYAPAESYQLPLIDTAAAPAWAETINVAFSKLNDVLFGPQEYAIVATTPT